MNTIWKWIDALARFVIRMIGKVSPKLGGFCLLFGQQSIQLVYITLLRGGGDGLFLPVDHTLTFTTTFLAGAGVSFRETQGI